MDNATPGFDPDALDVGGLDVRILPQDHNTTFTGGNNIAFGEARGRFVLLLNPDTRVEPEALERAIEHLDTEPALVALGAYLVDEHGDLPPLLPSAAARAGHTRHPHPATAGLDAHGASLPHGRRDLRYGTVVEQPAGAFILLRRDTAPTALLDPGYFNFFSDVELCRTLNEAGEIRVEPDVRCFHARGGAGLITYDPAARSRLHLDLVWGVRHYFRHAGVIERVGWNCGSWRSGCSASARAC